MDIIQTNSSHCGSGKTFDATTAACHGITQGKKTSIAVPSRRLARQVKRDARRRFPQLKAHIACFVSDPKKGETAISRITKYLLERQGGQGDLLIITHAALQMISHWQDKGQWHLFVDEEITSECHIPVKLKRPETRAALCDLFRIHRWDDHYSVLEAVDHGKLMDIRDNLYDDQIDEMFAPLTMRLLPSSSWDLFVRTTQWEEFFAGKSNRFDVHGLLHPQLLDGFASVRVMAANVDDTLMAAYWREIGRNMLRVTPKPVTPIGYRLTIKYLPVPKWSKRLRDMVVCEEDGTTVGEMYAQLCAEEARKHDPNTGNHLYITNLDNTDVEFGGVALPTIPHGMNDYENATVCAIFTALNRQPAHEAFLCHMLGITEREIRRATVAQVAYQAACRGNIRNKDTDGRFLLLLPDQAMMEDCARIPHFEGCQQEPLITPHNLPDIAIKKSGRPVEYDTDEARKLAQQQLARQRKRRQRWREKMSREITNSISVYRDALPPNTPIPDAANLGGFWISHWDSRAASWRPDELWEVTFDRHFAGQNYYTTQAFFDYLHTCATTKAYASKKDNCMICPAAFNLALDMEHGHSYSNIVTVMGVLLDLDHTDATPDDIANVLAPFTLAIYSSWSNAPDDHAYRVAIPTITPMTIESYRAMLLMLRQRFEDHGFVRRTENGRKHGIDQNALNAARLYYLPCIRPDGFFRAYRPEGEAIDPLKMIEGCPTEVIDLMTYEPQPPPDQVERTQEYKDRHIHAAVQYFRDHGRVRGEGHRQIYHLYRWLTEIGCSNTEAADVMYAETPFTHNERERNQDVKYLTGI
jgi:hypothetical protein